MDAGAGDAERQIRNLPGTVKKVVQERGGAIPWDQQCFDNPGENHFLPVFRADPLPSDPSDFPAVPVPAARFPGALPQPQAALGEVGRDVVLTAASRSQEGARR